MFDLTIYETGNGGDLVALNTDLEQTDAIYSMIYMALFGGNYEAVTREDEVPGEQRFDFWANDLFWKGDKSLQFNSQFEKTINEVALTSSGRLRIQAAAISDLDFLKDFGKVTVDVYLIGIDKLEVVIKIQEPTIQENKIFRFIWDATKQQLITNINAGAIFSYEPPNILENGLFINSDNWNLANYLNAATAVFNNTCEITVGASVHLFAVYTNQKFTAGYSYRITYECISLTAVPGDNWQVGFGSNATNYTIEVTGVIATAAGLYSGEVFIPTGLSDDDNIRLIIGVASVSLGAGVFEIKNLTVKRVL